MEQKDFDREIGFIAKHYKAGIFNTKKALRLIKPMRNIWSWQRIAVASCIIIVLGATAGLLIRNSYNTDQTEKLQEIENKISPKIPIESVSKIIDFDDTPLQIVIEQINLVYDVEISNIPANAEDYRISLHYEGNVVDLIDSINEILGINLEIKK